VESAAAAVLPIVRQKNLKLDLALAAGLPLVSIKETVLRQLVLSLLTNACRASADDSAVTVRAESATTNGSKAASGRMVALTFRDTGGGVPPEDRERVFGTRPNLSGGQPVRGLGDSNANLTVVQKLAQAGGGDLVFDSVAGVGTTFTLRLPAAELRPWSGLTPRPEQGAPEPPTAEDKHA
jgi:signal transduction histidine kinase